MGNKIHALIVLLASSIGIILVSAIFSGITNVTENWQSDFFLLLPIGIIGIMILTLMFVLAEKEVIDV